MIAKLAASRPSRLGLWALILVLGGTVSLALARQDAPKNDPAKGKLEYLSQEVQPGNMVPTLNDLSGQGWDVFQVVPIWKVESANGESSLVPKAYQVFGRRPAGPGFR